MTQVLIPVSSGTSTTYFLSLSGQAFQVIVRLASILNDAIANQTALSFMRGWRFAATSGGLNLSVPSFSSLGILKPVLSFLQSNLPHLQAACEVVPDLEGTTLLTRTCLSALQDFVGGLHAHYEDAAAASSGSVVGSGLVSESAAIARAIVRTTGVSPAAVAHELQSRALPTMLESVAAVVSGTSSGARSLKSMPPPPPTSYASEIFPVDMRAPLPRPVSATDGSNSHMIAWIVLSIVLILVIACVICAAVFCLTKAFKRRRAFHQYQHQFEGGTRAILPIPHADVPPICINMTGAGPAAGPAAGPVQAAVPAAPIFYAPLVRPASYLGEEGLVMPAPALCVGGVLRTPESFYREATPEIILGRASCPTAFVDGPAGVERGYQASCPPPGLVSGACLAVDGRLHEGWVPTSRGEFLARIGAPISPEAIPSHFRPITSPFAGRRPPSLTCTIDHDDCIFPKPYTR